MTEPVKHISVMLIFIFEPPFSALRGNVRTPSMARWKAHGRLYIHRD